MEISKLQKEIHDNAVNHGWWEKERPLPETLCLIHSEISEAFEAYEDDNIDLFGEEIADVLIRTLDAAGGYDFIISDPAIGLDSTLNKVAQLNPNTVYYGLNKIHLQVDTVLEAHRDNDQVDIRVQFAGIVYCIQSLCKIWGIDLERETMKKHEINKKRPYRHGNKVC